MPSDVSPPDWDGTLRARRNAANLTRRKLAAESGVSVKMIAAIETGVRRAGPDTRAKLDRALSAHAPAPTLEERLAALERLVLGAA